MRCLNCKSLNIVKKGKRKTKFGYRQLYYCKDCRLRFADSKLSHKSYGPKVITGAISFYNLGHSLEEAARLINKRYKVKVGKSSVDRWIKENKRVCTFHKLRARVVKDCGQNIIYSKTFEHKNLAYDFKYHQAKLDILCARNKLDALAEYIRKFEQGCPDFFDDIPRRCSQIKIKVRLEKQSKYNNACRLAEFALLSCRHNKERHSVVEKFMLINDSSTVAVEVPVWLYEKSLGTSINGHIDLLQVRGGRIYILDFKPGAEKENEQKVASQLYWYASGLSFRTGIPLGAFRCAWFDDGGYFEFDPRKASRV